MSSTSRLFVLLAATTPLLAGCDPIGGVQGGNPIGIAVLNARTQGSGYTTSPQVAFYRVASATFLSAQGVQDSCVNIPYFGTGGTSTTATAIGGGSYVLIEVSGQVDSLRRTPGSADQTYRASQSSGITFTPGDSIVITVPGERSGFPTATFRGRTAEPFTMNPTTIPPTGEPMTLSWTPATDGNSAMFIQLRFTTGTASTFNRQVSCSFRDDGSGTIAALLLEQFYASGLRDTVPIAQRVRTIVAQVDVPLSYFNMVSEFDRPTPVSP